MRELTSEEKEFLISLTKRTPSKRGTKYFCYTLNKKHFRRSRVLMQLHLNKKLDMWEIVHHKDMNTENDNINNLEVKDSSVHTSEHQTGKHHASKGNKHGIDTETINKLLGLCKTITHKNGKPHLEKIGKELNLAGQTIARYYYKSLEF